VILQVEERLIKHINPDFSVTKIGTLLSIHVPAGKSVQEHLETNQIQVGQPVVAVVNGKTADLAEVLHDGDRVRLLPQIAGG
jgi:molybdopterin converting factor small subunit